MDQIPTGNDSESCSLCSSVLRPSSQPNPLSLVTSKSVYNMCDNVHIDKAVKEEGAWHAQKSRKSRTMK